MSSHNSTAAFSNHNSILSRPLKTNRFNNYNSSNDNLYSNSQRHNAENAEVEYEREQRRLEARRQRFNQLYENRRVSLWGGQEEKKQLQEQRRNEIQDHLNVREQHKRNELVHDFVVAQENRIAENDMREIEKTRAIQKRQYLRQIMEENKKLEEYRKQQEMNERRRDMNQDQNQVDFFDRHRSYR